MNNQGQFYINNVYFPYKINSKFQYSTIKASLIIPGSISLESNLLFDNKVYWFLSVISDKKNILINAKLDGNVQKNNNHFSVTSTQSHISINNQIIECDFDIKKSYVNLQINSLDNGNKFHLDITNLNKNPSVKWQLDISNLSLYQKQLSGNIYSYAIFNNHSNEKFSCRISGKNLKYHSLNIRNINFEIKDSQIGLQTNIPQFSEMLYGKLKQLSLKSIKLDVNYFNFYLPTLRQNWKLKSSVLLQSCKNHMTFYELRFNNRKNILYCYAKITDLIPMQYRLLNINSQAILLLQNFTWVGDLLLNFPIIVKKGKINRKIVINNCLYKPSIYGAIHLKNGSVELLNFSNIIDYIYIKVNLLSPLNINLDFTGKINDQMLSIKSDSIYYNNMLNTKGHITGKSFKLLNSHEILLLISPKLTFTHQYNKGQLSSSIDIDTLRVNLDVLKSTRLRNTIQNDIIYVSKQKKNYIKKRMPFDINININFGENAQISGFNINTKITGQLNINKERNQPIVGVGEVKTTQGSFSTHGKTFNIDKTSKIFFNNTSINNPFINTTASYIIPDSSKLNQPNLPDKIIIKINRDSYNPKILLNSQPSISQINILSYILFSQSITDNNHAKSSSAISQVAIILEINQGGIYIFNKLKQNFSFSEFSLGALRNASNNKLDSSTISNSNTAIFIGQWMTNKLYISYGIGIFKEKQQCIASYALTPQ